MYRRLLPLLLLLASTTARARGPEVTLDVGTLELAGHHSVRNVQVHCPALEYDAGIRCENAQFTATLPGVGQVKGAAQAQFIHSKNWRANIRLVRTSQKLADLQKLAAAFGLNIPGEMSGKSDLLLTAELTPTHTQLKLELGIKDLTYSEATGRYATDKLAAEIQVFWDSATQHWAINAESRGGQLYLEPVFLDFSVLPLQLELRARATNNAWQLERLQVQQGKAGTLQGSGFLGSDFSIQKMKLSLDANNLSPLVASDLQPFLIGTRLEGLNASGRLRAEIEINAQKPTLLHASLQNMALDADKLGVSFADLSGELNWSLAEPPPSLLRWSSASVQKIALGSSQISFRASNHDFELLSPWQQPMLEGALKVERLLLRSLGSPTLTADFSGELLPINLKELCKSLGWPEFGGTLGGRLPGLSIRDNIWSVDGALEAQAFDGSVRLEHLRAIEPFGVLPRVAADIHLSRLDLERVTSVFSFGRITGRLDGDVTGLRLLAWKPIAFDGRIYSSDKDDSRRRISQRAIDNISSIGGGPTGILSRGFLSFFEDFAYDRIGMRCVLRDGRCQMSGIEPTSSKDGQAGYYLVKGRQLPRIDVVGYAQSVSWNNLISQIQSARASAGPQTQAPAPPP